MIGSLVKELFGWRRGEAQDPDYAYFDYTRITRGVTENAQRLLANGYLDYPVFVHLETLAICNAACDFCPYTQLARKGARMPDSLIEKVIDDLTAIPPDLPFQLAPYKVSDPFLEPRLFDIVELASARLPGMGVSMITNGTALVQRQIDRLVKLPRMRYMNISLNYDNAEEYEAVMHLPFERTLSRLDALHQRKAAGEITFPVNITRVSSDRASDRRFVAWVAARYPGFPALIIPRNDWIGEVVTEGAVTQVLDAPCHRWFDISITATGIVAMCCMDGHARYPKGDVRTRHVLEIYNRPELRELRRALVSRRDAGSPCDGCTYLVS